MPYKRLYLFIEGPMDKRFIDNLVKPTLSTQYNYIKSVEYASLRKDKIKGFIRSIILMHDADLIFFCDIDRALCITKKKESLMTYYPSLTEKSIIIVIKEMESWLMAGLNCHSCDELGIEPCQTTDTLTKEDFQSKVKIKYDSSAEFVLELFKYYNFSVAIEKNRSLRYFYNTYIAPVINSA